MRVFLLLFLLFPLLELAVMIKVGGSIGVLAVLLLIIGAGILGVMLIRVAGPAMALRARERLARGDMPEAAMLEGLMLAVAGLLLLFPGFISDVLAVLCLLPMTRNLLLRKLRQKAEEQARRQRAFADDLAARQSQRTNVIDGEYKRHDR
jgi:UPF0716 protein FxsA